MIFVNFKTFEESSGKAAIGLVHLIEEVASQSQLKIIPVVQAADIKEAVTSSKLEVWAQKVDPVEFGAHTGSVIPEAVVDDGAVGTFLNHSEAKFENFEDLKAAHMRATQVGLKTLIFAADIEELKKVLELKPTFVSYEPPELIGNATTSVSQAKPEIVKEAAEVAKTFGVPLIVGAGIHNMEDVKKSLELGAVGVAVASGIIKAEDQKKALQNLVEGFK